MEKLKDDQDNKYYLDIMAFFNWGRRIFCNNYLFNKKYIVK
jgi:hypothetical protein